MIRVLRPTVVAALAVLSAGLLGARQATFSSKVEVVRVDALVTDGSRPVRGLGPSEFVVRDNGVAQAVDFVSFERSPLDVILVLDSSKSIAGQRLEHLRAAALAALAGLRDRDQAALVRFDHHVTLDSPPTLEFARLRAAIEAMTPQGMTALYDALHAGIVLGGARESRTVLLVFTDGIDTASFLKKEAVLDSARRGDTVVCVALEGPRRSFLDDLADITGGSVSIVRSSKDLPGLFVKLLDEFRQRYLIGYTPKDVGRGGWHRIDVSVKGRDYAVRARTGYQSGR
jgi:Ca-activated chloride channel homolog